MKNCVLFMTLLCVGLMFCGCSEDKTFKKSDGTEFVAVPYGWMDSDKKIDGVQYELSTSTIVLSVVFSETLAVPVLLTGLELWQPIAYVEPKE